MRWKMWNGGCHGDQWHSGVLHLWRRNTEAETQVIRQKYSDLGLGWSKGERCQEWLPNNWHELDGWRCHLLKWGRLEENVFGRQGIQEEFFDLVTCETLRWCQVGSCVCKSADGGVKWGGWHGENEKRTHVRVRGTLNCRDWGEGSAIGGLGWWEET